MQPRPVGTAATLAVAGTLHGSGGHFFPPSPPLPRVGTRAAELATQPWLGGCSGCGSLPAAPRLLPSHALGRRDRGETTQRSHYWCQLLDEGLNNYNERKPSPSRRKTKVQVFPSFYFFYRKNNRRKLWECSKAYVQMFTLACLMQGPLYRKKQLDFQGSAEASRKHGKFFAFKNQVAY